jgi:hypothetical protein
MRITKIMAIQIKKRHACLMITIMRNMATMAAIIKKGGELMNSGIIDSTSWDTVRYDTLDFSSY